MQLTFFNIQMPKIMMQAMKHRKAKDIKAVKVITTCIRESNILGTLCVADVNELSCLVVSVKQEVLVLVGSSRGVTSGVTRESSQAVRASSRVNTT